MNFISRQPWDPSLHRLTDESVYRNRGLHRREFLASLGLGSAGLLLGGSLPGCGEHKPDERKLKAAAEVAIPKASQGHYPAKRNPAAANSCGSVCVSKLMGTNVNPGGRTMCAPSRRWRL